MERIDRLAKKRGMTRSAYIVAKALEVDTKKSA
jgi:hypothetical protein